jgi:hypothetical protein
MLWQSAQILLWSLPKRICRVEFAGTQAYFVRWETGPKPTGGGNKMKRLSCVTVACLVFVVAGCATISVTSDHDPAVDFSSYKTYAFVPRVGSGVRSPLMLKRVQAAIDSVLATKGYGKSTTNPDFLVALHGATQDKVNITDYGYHSVGPYWGGARTVDVHHYTEGTLVIDIIDIQKRELAWRGTGTGVIGNDPAKLSGTALEAVRKVLAGFPPQ